MSVVVCHSDVGLTNPSDWSSYLWSLCSRVKRFR